MRTDEPDCWKSQERPMARPSPGLGLGEWDRLEEEKDELPLGHVASCREKGLVFVEFGG